MPLIEAHHLTRTFTNEDVATHALRDATFTIKQGEFVAIMGASGSGKSTLLHLLGLLDRPTTGRYSFKNKNTAHLTDQEQARLRNKEMGFVFQSFHLLSRANVLENVTLPLYYSHTPESSHTKKAKAAIEQVELTHRISHTPGQLSGGEKQRVAIARALVNQPDIIFADEPTGNLDSKTGQTVMALIDQLHRDSHTIIVITHETTVAQYAQRIITLHDGKITADKATASSHHHYSK